MSGKKITCLACGQLNRSPYDRLAAAKCGKCGGKLLSDKVCPIVALPPASPAFWVDTPTS